MSEPAPSCWRWQCHRQVASTQDLAIASAHAGDPGSLAVLAEIQDSGRGSRGRLWISPPGNLNLSILLRPNSARLEPGRWALMAGVALHRALSPYQRGMLLKWPNDLLCEDGKLGGILIDSQWQAGQANWVVIGLGANLAAAPDLGGRRTACLPSPAPEPMLVAAAILHHIDVLQGRGMEEICTEWLSRAHPAGTMLDVRTPYRSITAAFAGLSPRGELLLDGCEAPISSAEIGLTDRPGAQAEPEVRA